MNARKLVLALLVSALWMGPMLADPVLPVGGILDDPDPAGIQAAIDKAVEHFYAAHPWAGPAAARASINPAGEIVVHVEPRQFFGVMGTCDPKTPEDCTKRLKEECGGPYVFKKGTLKPGTTQIVDGVSCSAQCEKPDGSLEWIEIVCPPTQRPPT